MSPPAEPGVPTPCCVPHILPQPQRTDPRKQDSGLYAAALSNCTDAQCGFVVFLVLLFLQKPKEICRLSSAFPSWGWLICLVRD